MIYAVDGVLWNYAIVVYGTLTFVSMKPMCSLSFSLTSRASQPARLDR